METVRASVRASASRASTRARVYGMYLDVDKLGPVSKIVEQLLSVRTNHS